MIPEALAARAAAAQMIPTAPYSSYYNLLAQYQRTTEEEAINSRPFPFLNLPGELRNKIYRLVLVKSKAFTVKLQFGGSRTTSLMRTNKQIYQETSSIFYEENTFCFPQSLFVGAPIIAQLGKLYHLSEQRLQMMTSMIFHVTVSEPLPPLPRG